MRRTMPSVTRLLIFINVAVFGVEILRGDRFVEAFALWPIGRHFHVWQLVTHAFLHGNSTHLFFNMFALYMFGGEIERVFGARRYLEYYLVAVITAGATQLAVASLTAGPVYPTVGASGGVFGLLLAFAVLFPRRRLVLIFPPIPMPAWLFVTLYGAIELYLGVSGTQEGVAHFAHLGGMLGGWLLLHRWRRRALEAGKA